MGNILAAAFFACHNTQTIYTVFLAAIFINTRGSFLLMPHVAAFIKDLGHLDLLRVSSLTLHDNVVLIVLAKSVLHYIMDFL